MDNGIGGSGIAVSPWDGDVIQLRRVGSSNRHLESRGNHLTDWFNRRYEIGIDPYVKFSDDPIGPTTRAFDRKGRQIADSDGRSVNFASQDYLSLANHPEIKQAAIDAIGRYGVHSAGSPALMGNTRLSRVLEERLEAFTGFTDVTMFPTGWAAGYGIVRTLAQPTDHVVIDKLAHACLMEGAMLSTRNVHILPHLDSAAVIKTIRDIRAKDPVNGILVVTESLFSMDSDTPDIEAMQDACRECEATLMVDCAHDLGAMGATGRGQLETLNLVGKVDVLMGSFSKTFASNGGFVATNDPSLKLAIVGSCGPALFSNAMSPVQAAIVRAAIDFIESPDGATRRLRVLANSVRMRAGLQALGLKVIGVASPIVPFVIGETALARLLYRAIAKRGAVVNLVEFPAVARDAARMRLQVMSDHTPEQIDLFLSLLKEALVEATAEHAAMRR